MLSVIKNKVPAETITLWMNHLLVIYAFFLPISNRATATIFILILILFIYRGNYYYYLKIPLKNPVVITLSILFLMHIIWMYGTQNSVHAFRMFRNVEYTLYPIIFLSFLDKSFANKIIGGFIVGMLFTESISYLISFDILPEKLILFGHKLYATTKYDPSPFFSHSHYSTALAIIVALLIYNLATNKQPLILKLLSALFIISATTNLSIVGGRAGYLVFIIIIPLTFYLLYKKHFFKIFIPIILSISVIATLAYTYSPIFKDRINHSIQTLSSLYNDPGDYTSSFGIRLGLWNYSFDVIKENWLFGVGTGDHMDELNKVIKTHKGSLENRDHPHNQLISYTMQFGVFGLILYLSIFYQIFKYNYLTTYQKGVAYIVTTAIGIALMFENFRSAFYLPAWITLLSATLTTKTLVTKEYKPNLKMLISYSIIIVLVALNVFFQIN